MIVTNNKKLNPNFLLIHKLKQEKDLGIIELKIIEQY